MHAAVKPPDHWRLFAGAGDGAPPLLPPPLPPAGGAYSALGARYDEPPVFVAPLAAFGRQQLYDERCLQPPSAASASGDWPTPRGELRRCARARTRGEAAWGGPGMPGRPGG
jgi:hypothetical protein